MRSHDGSSREQDRDDPIRTLATEVARLTRATANLRAQIASRHQDGVEWSAYALLSSLVKSGPLRSSVLAETACLDPSTISRHVSQLVRLGLVDREADPEDGRATLLVATAAGRAAWEAGVERRRRVFSLVVEDWTEDEVRALGQLLARLNDSLADLRPRVVDALAGPPVADSKETA